MCRNYSPNFVRMRRILIRTLKILGLLAVLFFGFLVWYQWRYSMDEVEPYAINHPEAEERVLIATQGSEYKNEVTNRLVEYLNDGERFIQVIDVTSIEGTNTSIWDAIVIMHTWEKWEPQVDASKFLKSNYDPNKVFVLATSGSGEQMIEGIDGISGASIMDDVDLHAETLAEQVLTALR